MPKQKYSGSIFIKSLTSGESVWKYRPAKNDVFCKLCCIAFNYDDSNVKWQCDRHSTRENHVKQVRLNAKRQQTLSFAANLFSKNLFLLILQRRLFVLIFRSKSHKTQFLKLFLENTAKSAPDECTVRKPYLPSLFKYILDIVKDNIGDAEYFVMEDEAIDGFSSTIAGVFKSLPKKFHSAKERRRRDFLGFLIVQLGAENQNTFGDIKKFRKKCLPMPKKTVKPILLSCIVTKSLLTMVPHGGTLWKHPRVLFKCRS